MRYLTLNLPYWRLRRGQLQGRQSMFHFTPMIPPCSIKFPTQLPVSQPPSRQSATALLSAHRLSAFHPKHHQDNSGSYCRLTPLPLAPTMGLRFKLGPRKQRTQNGLTSRNPSHDYFRIAWFGKYPSCSSWTATLAVSKSVHSRLPR